MVLPLLCACMMMLAAAGVPALHAQSLSVQGSLIAFDQIGVTDLDFQNFHSNRPYFTLSMTLSGVTQPLDVVLHLDVSAQLADGTSLNPLATAVSQPFPLPPGTTTITSTDLNTRISLDAGQSGLNEEGRKHIEDAVRTTSRLPYGTYTFRVWLTGGNAMSQPLILDVIIQNPSRVELLAPSNGVEWPNQFPVFQWSSSTDDVIFSVYEKTAGTQSAQEAINGVPQIQTRLHRVNTFQYPASGAGVRQLEQGKSYYWYVQGVSTTGSNTEAMIPSEIWLISIAGQSGGVSGNTILDQLGDISGSQFQEIIARLLEMGFQPTGLLRIGGVTMTWMEFLQKVRSGEYTINNMTIE